MVQKSSGKWRMCVDYTELNKACPKDSYPLSTIDQLVDGVGGHHILNLLNAYSGYNQIYMHPRDDLHKRLWQLLLRGHVVRPYERRGHIPAANGLCFSQHDWRKF